MAKAVVEDYANRHWKFVVWPQIGDIKGPKEANWPQKKYSLDDYKEGNRVGLLTGQEVAPGEYLHDIDVDWAPGVSLAAAILPTTEFVFGRASKKISHLFFVTDEPIPTIKYADLDGTTLLELRGVKSDGELGFQTMVPPSIWTKGDRREPLEFVNGGGPNPAKVPARELKDLAATVAIGMMFAKHCDGGKFTHEVRLAWAGFMIKAGIEKDVLIKIGRELVRITGNKDVADIDMVVNSTYDKHKNGSPHTGIAELRKTFGNAIVELLRRWVNEASSWITDKRGLPLANCVDNIRIGFDRLRLSFEFDVFSEKRYVIEQGKGRQIISDDVENNIYLQFEKDFKFLPNATLYTRVLTNLGWQNQRHPVQEYLDTLQWDGVPRIDEWLINYAGVEDNPYVRAVSSIMLIAAVRRVRQPGCKYDEMVILEGIQGTGKSTLLRNLCPDENWFSDNMRLDLQGKEIIEHTAGKWIIEIAELTGRNKAEVNQLKAMLSRQMDGPVRLAYAKTATERPRHFIFVGTVNDNQYITDPTGARRFWPVKTTTLDFKGVAESRDQLWAEANIREKAGESIRMKESLWSVAEAHQEERFEADPWEDSIREIITQIRDVRQGGLYITTDSLMEVIGIEKARRTKSDSRRINDIMARLKFQNTPMRNEDGNVVRGFVRKNYKEGDKLWD